MPEEKESKIVPPPIPKPQKPTFLKAMLVGGILLAGLSGVRLAILLRSRSKLLDFSNCSYWVILLLIACFDLLLTASIWFKKTGWVMFLSITTAILVSILAIVFTLASYCASILH